MSSLEPKRRDERREPAFVRGVRILAREDERLASCELCAKVARAPVVEVLGRDLVHAGPEPAGLLRAAVGRARVDHDDLDLLVHGLARDRLEAADEVAAAVLHGDDDGDHAGAGVAATTNWYAKSDGRMRPTACAAASTRFVPITGTGVVKSKTSMG